MPELHWPKHLKDTWELICEGHTSAEIAEMLKVKRHTVNIYSNRIREFMGAARYETIQHLALREQSRLLKEHHERTSTAN